MRVVVADDDLSQRFYLSGMLDRMGHEALPAADGREALGLLERGDASVVISDIEMPGMDGLDLARTVRARSFGRYIYVVLVTGRDRPQDYVLGLDAGADDFMSKPVEPPILAVRLRAAERVLTYDRELQVKSRHLEQAKRQIEDDLAAAGEAQRALLPKRDLTLGSCLVQRLFVPSQFLSGDMFNYFDLGEGRIGFYAADVSGHGVRPALLAASLGHLITRGLFVDAVLQAGCSATPEELADRLNRRFVNDEDVSNYFSFVCGVIDQHAQKVTLCQAGHPHPLLIRGDGEHRWLGSGGTPLGLFAGVEYERTVDRFGPGDRLFIHSDGITEAADTSGEQYGDDRLVRFALERRRASARVLCEQLVPTLSAWTGQTEFKDDISMIVFDRSESDNA